MLRLRLGLSRLRLTLVGLAGGELLSGRPMEEHGQLGVKAKRTGRSTMGWAKFCDVLRLKVLLE